jgi:hypothetical protein
VREFFPDLCGCYDNLGTGHFLVELSVRALPFPLGKEYRAFSFGCSSCVKSR